MQLKPIQISDYYESGFIVLRDVIPQSYINTMIAELDALLRIQFSLFFPEPYPGKDLAIIRLYNRNKNYRRTLYKWISTRMLTPHIVYSSELILEICKSLGNTSPVFQMFAHRINLPNEDYYLTEWHQDIGIMDTENSLVFWMPLESNTHENGAIALKSGSHNAGVLEPCMINYRGHSELSTEHLDSYQEVFLEYEPGDLLVFNPKTIHNAMPNRSDKPRWSSIFRFEDSADTKYLDLPENPLHRGYIMKKDNNTASGFAENPDDKATTDIQRSHTIKKYRSL